MEIHGTVVESQGKGQSYEIKASDIVLVGEWDEQSCESVGARGAPLLDRCVTAVTLDKLRETDGTGTD